MEEYVLKNKTSLTKDAILKDPYNYTLKEMKDCLGEEMATDFFESLYKNKPKIQNQTVKIKEVLKREYLIDEVWQGDTEFVDAHAVTVAVKRLRDKLEDDTQKPEYVKTVYGIGYTWAVNG